MRRLGADKGLLRELRKDEYWSPIGAVPIAASWIPGFIRRLSFSRTKQRTAPIEGDNPGEGKSDREATWVSRNGSSGSKRESVEGYCVSLYHKHIDDHDLTYILLR